MRRSRGYHSSANQFHGDLSEYLQNDHLFFVSLDDVEWQLSARRYFNNTNALRLQNFEMLAIRMAMPQQTDFPLPFDLPQPVDDGAADHLGGMLMPQISLPSTADRLVDLSNLVGLRTVLYCYPMTGVPGKPLPQGWDRIPGARGCTPQACGFRDHHQELSELKADVFGLSTQTTEYQREMADRVHLPFQILSDAEFKLCDALHLPTFEVDGMRLVKRLTLIVRARRIEHLFYPVFPPNESADQVMRWLRAHQVPD